MKDAHHAALRSKLLPGGKWDTFAFVDACETAAGPDGEVKLAQILREIQAAEFRILLEFLIGP